MEEKEEGGNAIKKHFELIVLITAFLAYLLTVSQWIIIVAYRNKFYEYKYISFAFLLLAIVLSSVFLLRPEIRLQTVSSILLSLVIMESVTLSPVVSIVEVHMYYLVLCVCANAAVVAIIIIISRQAKCVIPVKDDKASYVLMLFIIFSTILLFMSFSVSYILAASTYCALLHTFLIVSLIIHAQVFRKDNERNFPDIFYAIFAFYMHFVIMCLLFYLLLALLWKDLENVSTFINPSDATEHMKPTVFDTRELPYPKFPDI